MFCKSLQETKVFNLQLEVKKPHILNNYHYRKGNEKTKVGVIKKPYVYLLRISCGKKKFRDKRVENMWGNYLSDAHYTHFRIN